MVRTGTIGATQAIRHRASMAIPSKDTRFQPIRPTARVHLPVSRSLLMFSGVEGSVRISMNVETSTFPKLDIRKFQMWCFC